MLWLLYAGRLGGGSDLDLVAVVSTGYAEGARDRRHWKLDQLPVPADLLVYTQEEWARLDRNGRFWKTLQRETIWVYETDV